MSKSPDAFRTISEAAVELDLPQHVLRFWETRFTQIKPLKRGGGRRFYRPDDVALLTGIRHLLYDKGYTIKGVQKILKEQGVRAVIDLVGVSSDSDQMSLASPSRPKSSSVISSDAHGALNQVLQELLQCKRKLDAARDK